MNKADAAELLGVTPRAVERYVKDGKLTQRYVKGRTGKVADFDETELRELEASMKASPIVRPVVMRHDDATHDIGESVAVRSSPGLSDVSGVAALVAAIESAAMKRGASVENRLILTLAEAADVSGLSKDFLSRAIHDGRLKASKEYGRGWKMKRTDLDSYVKEL